MSARRDERGRKNSGGAALQPIGYGKPRTLSPHSRRIQIQSNRDMTENNPLGNALLSRWVDNVIGEGMTAKPKTSDKGFNEEVAHWWTEEYQADATGRFSNSEMQRIPAMSYCRDGDVGATMLKSGQLQIIESDYVRSPNRADDMYLGRGVEPDIVDGVKVNASGRPETYYIESLAGGEIKYAAVPARNFLFLANYDRANRTATRGTPLISVIRPLLDAIDATNEAVVMAHRIAASFGAMIKKDNPAQASSNLPTFGADPAAGEINRKYTMQPGMMEHLNPGESIEQIKPEHPTANYGDFISLQIRMAGVVLGMPLELALLDFSKTNYSSARASLEQSYRSFRVQQRRFADQWATKWYRWRVSKAVKSGVFGGGVPEDFQRHTWMAQPWPYLDPVKDAQGIMAMIDAGPTTLSDELAKRGYSFGDWIDMKREEIDRAAEAGVPLLHSNVSREASGPKVAQSAASTESENPEEPEQPDDDNDNEEENGAEGDQ
jgi:lambda family phage portal protein